METQTPLNLRCRSSQVLT